MGLAAVYSATYTARGPSPLFYKQIIWISIGIVVMFLALIPDYHTIGRYAYILYACSAPAPRSRHGDRHGPAWARSAGSPSAPSCFSLPSSPSSR